ncbi:deoxyribodipyrimidine photo-lyase [soil metagenome]
MAVQLVWYKKDLRVADHAPLTQACKNGPVVCVYVIEPEILSSAEFDSSHQVFINQCLEELHQKLLNLNNGLLILHDNLPEAFEKLRREIPFEKIWCHEEIGNRVTYDRDLRVQSWCKKNGIAYEELPQTGVVRRLKSRDGWSEKWFSRMKAARIATPDIVAPHSFAEEHLAAHKLSSFGKIFGLDQLGLPPSTKPLAQIGGEAIAQTELASFIFERSKQYRFGISSPISSRLSCSRLSPYLAFGAISLRTVYQASVMRRVQLAKKPDNGSWQKSLSAFEERLIWHCHFMQKLEDEPEVEFQNISKIYDGLREDAFRQDYFDAWCEGLTGYPMIDACMRALKESGWINFRMRAMLVSFASYNLWLHWQPTAVYLARHFLDFEPGIHYPQFQMQSGTTGINDIRVYSATKQGRDQDPDGSFIRHYVPELANVPIEYLHQPELMPPLFQQFHGCIIGKDYPAPIVDEQNLKMAKERIFDLKKTEAALIDAQRVQLKHGSRKKPQGKEWR